MVDFNSVAYVTGLAVEVGALFWLVNASVLEFVCLFSKTLCGEVFSLLKRCT